MKMRVRFFNGEIYDFPEVREETIAIDDKLISFVFRGGHVASIALRSFLFVEEMPDDEVTEQVTQPVEDDEEYDYEKSGIPKDVVDAAKVKADILLKSMIGGVSHVEEENSK